MNGIRYAAALRIAQLAVAGQLRRLERRRLRNLHRLVKRPPERMADGSSIAGVDAPLSLLGSLPNRQAGV